MFRRLTAGDPRLLLPALALLLVLTAAQSPPRGAGWPAWGGPSRDFNVPEASLAARWDGAPPLLWERPLGAGYAAIAADSEALYTMASQGSTETLLALDAATGQERWRRDETIDEGRLNLEYGPGPHASPVLAGDLVISVGSTGSLVARQRHSGELVWRRELWDELGGTVRDRGYSSTPLIWRDRVFAFVGGRGKSVVAFAVADGREIWRGGDFSNGHASPLLIEIDGRPVLVAFMSGDVAGFDADSGALLWSHPHETAYGLNISTPVFGQDGILFVSSAYGSGSRGLRLSARDDGVEAEELWFNNRVRLHFGTAIRIDDVLYFTSGDFGPAFLAAVRASDGEILWRDRTFAKGSLLYADGRGLLLDEEGTLALLELRPDGFEVLGSAQVLEARAWTVPTLVGSTLYVRDTRQLKAIDVGPQATERRE